MTASIATDQTARQLVIFTLGGAEYALPITDVQEVIRYTEPRTVEEAGAAAQGIISVRGQLIPICNLRSRLGVAADVTETSKIVIVERAGDHFGILVESVDEVTTVEPGELEASPLGDLALVSAIAKLGERLVLVLDAGGLRA